MKKKQQELKQDDELLMQETSLAADSTPVVDSVSTYFREIGAIPLLTPEQELSLATRVRAGLDAELLLEQAEDAEQRKLLCKVQADGKVAQDQLAKANLRLVVREAKRYENRGLELPDLVQEGNLGLLKAAEKYRADAGTRFCTFAVYWIRQGISRAVTNYSRTIRLPSHIFHQVAHLRKAKRELTALLEREPSEEELAQQMGVKVSKVKELQQYDKECASLDMPIGGEEDHFTLGDTARGENPFEAVEDSMTQTDLQGALAKALNELTERQRLILVLRFNLDGGGERTLDEIGQIVGVTRERVRQIVISTLEQLRSGDTGQLLKSFIA